MSEETPTEYSRKEAQSVRSFQDILLLLRWTITKTKVECSRKRWHELSRRKRIDDDGRLAYAWSAELSRKKYILKMFDANVAKDEKAKMAILLLCISKAQLVVFDNYLKEKKWCSILGIQAIWQFSSCLAWF